MDKRLLIFLLVLIPIVYAGTLETLQEEGICTSRFEESVELGEDVTEDISFAYAIKDKIDVLTVQSQSLEDIGVTINSTLLNRADFEFSICNFEGADELLNEFNNSVNIVTSQLLQELNPYNPGVNILTIVDTYHEYNEYLVAAEIVKNISIIVNFSRQNELPENVFKDILDESLFYLNIKKFSRLTENYAEIENEYRNALSAQALMTEAESYSIDILNELELYNNGEFQKVIASLSRKIKDIEEIRSRQILQQVSERRDFDWQLMIKLVVIIFCIIALFLFLNRKRIRKLHLENLKKVQKQTLENIKNLQEKYYVKKQISKREYDASLKIFQTKLIKVTRILGVNNESQNN